MQPQATWQQCVDNAARDIEELPQPGAPPRVLEPWMQVPEFDELEQQPAVPSVVDHVKCLTHIWHLIDDARSAPTFIREAIDHAVA